MTLNAGARAPRARKDGLIIKELPDEILIYDRACDKAHCLNHTAALVWKYADGRNSVPDIASKLGSDLNAKVDEKLVWYALDQLNRDHLLAETFTPPQLLAGMSRREAVRALGVAAIVAVPLVTSIVAPTPAQAATCTGTGTSCASPATCCSGTCSTGGGSCSPAQPAGTCC